MTDRLRLADPQAPADLDTFLGRAIQTQDGSARLVVAGRVLAVYVPVLFPTSLLDDSATILGLRTFALAVPDADGAGDGGDPQPPAELDVVVPMASLRARAASAAAGEGFELGIPAPVYSVSWSGVLPPRAGWIDIEAPVATDLLARVAETGIREVAAALPANAGEAIVRQVRAMVWGEPIEGAEALPKGAALAAAALGFLPPGGGVPPEPGPSLAAGGFRTPEQDGPAPGAAAPIETGGIYEVGPWTRLSLSRGHVLVKRRAWSLAG